MESELSLGRLALPHLDVPELHVQALLHIQCIVLKTLVFEIISWYCAVELLSCLFEDVALPWVLLAQTHWLQSANEGHCTDFRGVRCRLAPCDWWEGIADFVAYP